MPSGSCMGGLIFSTASDREIATIHRAIMEPPITIAGIVPLTTVDFPGCLACVVFCQGCAWTCQYCHNPHLQPFHVAGNEASSKWNTFLEFLEARRGFLDGVVLSGGEPLLQKRLLEAIQVVRKLGFKVGLHTAGPDPNRLKEVLCFLDWIGLDIKAPFDDRYAIIAGVHADPANVKKSLELVIASGIPHEIRTTVHPKLLREEDVGEIQNYLKFVGAKPSKIQPFRPEGCKNQSLLKTI